MNCVDLSLNEINTITLFHIRNEAAISRALYFCPKFGLGCKLGFIILKNMCKPYRICNPNRDASVNRRDIISNY